MPILGKNNIDPKMDKMTTIFAMELFAMKGRKKIIPSKVSTDAIKEIADKNCSSNFNTSISNQVSPGPGAGMARKIKIIIAVPTMV